MEHDSDQISHASSDSLISDEETSATNKISSKPKKIIIDPTLEV